MKLKLQTMLYQQLLIKKKGRINKSFNFLFFLNIIYENKNSHKIYLNILN